MNIFVLDENHDTAAQMMCDKHIVKMIVETAQLLSNAIWYHGGVGPLKQTHINHPCSIWARQSSENWHWLWNHLYTLLFEYEYRYNKYHKYSNSEFLNELHDNSHLIPLGEMTEFPQCMPEEYKVPGDAVAAYRAYYIGEKSKFAKWKLGNVPEWYTNGLIQSSYSVK